MGLFGHKLLLRIQVTNVLKGKQNIRIVRTQSKTSYLLPFSSVSVVGSQLITLSSFRPQSFSRDILDFISTPEIRYKTTLSMNEFELEVYKNNNLIYNQFKPQFGYGAVQLNNDMLESDIVDVLTNYVTTTYKNAINADKSKLRVALLTTIAFYQQEVTPIIKRINLNDIEQRKKLMRTMIDFSSRLYHYWKNPNNLTPNSAAFSQRVEEAKNFDAYSSQ